MTEIPVEKSLDDVSHENHGLEVSFGRILNTKEDGFQDLAMPAKHSRSKSAPDEKFPSANWEVFLNSLSQVKEDLKCTRKQTDEGKQLRKKKQHHKKDHRSTLEQDVKHLQTKLESQENTRTILEQALGRASSVLVPLDGNVISQHTRNLIKDIALLEFEVVQLEQHLLSLYHHAFRAKATDQNHVIKNFKADDLLVSPDDQFQQVAVCRSGHKPYASANLSSQGGSFVSKMLKSTVGSYSFNESKNNTGNSAHNTPKKDGRLRTAYSQPMPLSRKETEGSPLEAAYELWREVSSAEANASCIFSEPSLLGERISETPNKLSEELVRCMAAIYCKLADPPIPYLGCSISPSSSSSSASLFSPKELSSDGWSPQWRTDASSLSSGTHHPKSIMENIGHCNFMVEVPWICVDNDRLSYVAKMLRNFRYLVQQLESVNPGQLKKEEKLAFWLNIYNALVMHAYLAYGIPGNHLKRASLFQKAAYKIGARSINALTIEHTLLGCRAHRPAQWIQLLLLPGSKIRGVHREAYALERPEPLACFGICCGGRSDPAVRVYTAKNVYHELDAAKRDFLQANVMIRKENKIFLPRILESFAKETSMNSSGLLDWICENLPDKQQIEIKKCVNMKHQKCTEWIPYNFKFRYLFVRDLARWFPPNSA